MKQRQLAGQTFARLTFGAALLFVFLGIPFAFAQQSRCGPEDFVLDALSNNYGERQVASFLDRRGMLMRLLINLETRSWTLLALRPTGQACLIGFGDAFELDRPSANKDPGF